MAQIEIKNLTFKYAMADSSCLKNVSLNIENGDFVVVCGKSGCGKTTLLRCLKSVLTPNGDKAGEVLFENKSEEGYLEGYTKNYIHIKIKCDSIANSDLKGQVRLVRLTQVIDDYCSADIIND